MFEVVLHEPEIPPNTGNIIRLCANSGCRLHLIEPMGFTLDDARLRRAGLDYHEYAGVLVHPDLSACLSFLESQKSTPLDTQKALPDAQTTPLDTQAAREPKYLDVQNFQGARRVFAFSTRGSQRHDQICWRPGDIMIFGAETRGLPEDVLFALAEGQRVRLPMRPHNRSLNLSNAVAVAVFEAWRQLDFAGGC
ncbi:MAG: tRNA (cytidine(34)-2'-O)-methyltransferase [Gammaproteobacteria bacterium]|nr:tRNA (cytidine(34)-2'-O)-methyltransferase [Gammaproteobacteria bacterium]